MLASEILRRVREIQVRTGRQVADVLAGEYVSVFKGRGIEFDEVRPYVPGDDVRTIDWKVTARTGEPYVKRYVEERQLTLMLMADISASQDFGSGTRSKREAAAEFCALLAFSAIRNSDRVGLTLFHGDIEEYIPPRKGQKHALRVVREVLAHGADQQEPAAGEAGIARTLARIEAIPEKLRALPRDFDWAAFSQQTRASLRRFFARSSKRPRAARQSTDIANAMEFLLSVTTRKTICFVVSDFFDAEYERSLRAANRRHDVIAVLVTDARELDVPDVGLVSMRDAESGDTRVYDTGSSPFREAVRRDAHERIDALERRLRASNIDFIHVDATRPVVDPLVRFFRMRERRVRR